MSPTRQKFVQYIHNFRGLAILPIVFGHVMAFLDSSEYPLISSIIRAIIFNGSVYFVFIAGFLFQILSGSYNYQRYLKTKLLNVVVPYLIVSIPAICLCLVKNQSFYPGSRLHEFANWTVFHKIIYLYLTGSHFFHFWFLPMIFLFYITAPIFIYLDRHDRAYRILPALICLSILVPRARDDAFVIQNFIHFISVYTLGMFCAHYQHTVLLFMKKYWSWLLALASFLIALEIYLAITSSFLVDIIYLNTAAKSILSVVFMYLLWRCESISLSGFNSLVSKIADLSFGIYFLHAYIVYIYMYLVKILDFPIAKNLISLTLSALTIILLNVYVLTKLQQTLGRNSKYILGC